MDFIGLLGLLGLLGFFSGRGLESKINNRINNLPNNDSRIAQNEKFIADHQKEIERLHFALQNCVSTGDLNNFYRQLQNEIQRNYATNAAVYELERKISALPQAADIQAALRDINQRLAALEKRIDALENKKYPAPTAAPPADTKIFEQRIAALEFQISEQNKTRAQYQNYFQQVQAALTNLQNLNSSCDERIKKLETVQPPPLAVSPTPKLPTQEKVETVQTPPKKLSIQDFQLKKNNRPLFSNKPGDAKKTLATVENLSGIISFLEGSNFGKKDSFIRLIKNYQHNLQKFSDKVKRGKFDEDNFSEEVTNAFFGTLQKYFLSNLPVSIYRGNSENPKFYAAFLEKINEYLSACRVYTELVEPQKIMNHDDIEKMNIVKKDTAVKAEDKIIDEVERLPYFLDYLTDDGEIERFCFDGSMVVLKFDGGAK